MSRFALTLALALLGAFVLAGSSPPQKALPPEYRMLAEILSMDIRANPKQNRNTKKKLDDLIESLHNTAIELNNIKSSDAQINYIASQSVAAVSDYIKHLKRLNSLPKPPGTAELTAELFVSSFLLRNPHPLFRLVGIVTGGYMRGRDADDKQQAINDEINSLLKVVDEIDRIHRLLPRVAEKYAAPFSRNIGRIWVDFDESWGPVGPDDWLCLYNNGPDLEDCTILVELKGAKGDVRKNVHFLRKWSSDSWQYAIYAPGEKVLDRMVGRMTVYNVDTVDVTIFSPQYSTKIHYVYSGAEKDKDIADYCKDATFKWRYQPFEAGIIWNTDRGVVLTLDKIAFIPKCRVDVTFKSGRQSKGWYWEFDQWKRGETKTFSHRDLNFDPDTIEVTVSFPGTNHRIYRTLKLQQ